MKFDVDNKIDVVLCVCVCVCVKFHLNRCRFAVAVAKCLGGSLFWDTVYTRLYSKLEFSYNYASKQVSIS